MTQISELARYDSNADEVYQLARRVQPDYRQAFSAIFQCRCSILNR